MPDHFVNLDATAQAELIRKREATPLDLVDAAIARIERLNPQLNAVIIPLFEKAREQAKANALPDGPFRGVPFLLKDLFAYSAGDPNHMGTRRLRDVNFVAPHDAYLTSKFRAGGFVFLGRTNVPELGTLPTTEPSSYGASRNPWHTGHSTGGSSGGSAAAVAAGFVAAAHANDGGGSIRIPASECGLVGLRPSRGRTSLGPDLGDVIGGLVAEGVVTRSVRDTAGILDVIAGAMPGDPYTAPAPARPYRDEVGAAPGKLRVGVLTRPPGGTFQTHPDCVRAAEAAAKLVASLGHRVEESHPAAMDEQEVGQHFSMMYAVATAGFTDLIGLLSGSPLGPDDLDPLNWALGELGRNATAVQYVQSLDWIHGYTRRVASWWVDGFDVLLTPTLPAPPPRLGIFDPHQWPDPIVGGLQTAQFAAFTLPFNMTGQPAVSLPLGTSAEGLPIGIQLVGAYGREDVLLRLASQIEAAQPWSGRRPAVHG